jgi:hypothetical protein
MRPGPALCSRTPGSRKDQALAPMDRVSGPVGLARSRKTGTSSHPRLSEKTPSNGHTRARTRTCSQPRPPAGAAAAVHGSCPRAPQRPRRREWDGQYRRSRGPAGPCSRSRRRAEQGWACSRASPASVPDQVEKRELILATWSSLHRSSTSMAARICRLSSAVEFR